MISHLLGLIENLLSQVLARRSPYSFDILFIKLSAFGKNTN
mgnify:CR=1